MSKKKYPGVDEQALQHIARNFPSTAQIDHAHFESAADAPPAPIRVVDELEMLRAQAPHAPQPFEAAPQAPFASPPSQPTFVEPVNAPANEPVPVAPPPPLPDAAKLPVKAVRMSKLPIIVSLLALAVAAAPLLAPRLGPYAEKYDAPQWLGSGIEMLGGKQSLAALRAEALFAQERSESAAAEAALSAAIEDGKSRLLRLETSGSDLAATAVRLDRLDEAVALAGIAQLKAEEIRREFSTTLKNSEEGIHAAAARSEARALAIEVAARNAEQGLLAIGQDIGALRRGLVKQEEAAAVLGEAIAALATKRTTDRLELAAVADLTAQNVAALSAARDEVQVKVDLLNEQLAKFADALEAAVAMEISRSSSAISEATERAALADDRARGLEVRLSAYQENQLRVSRMSNVVVRLGAALLTSEPFMTEVSGAMSAFAGVADVAAPLDTLAAIAPTGAVTQSKLRENFVAWVGPQLRDLGVRYDASLWTRAYTIFFSQNRPTTPEGQRVWEVVAAAEKLLAQGDLANAVIQVARFEGLAGQIAADWLLQARTRGAADKAFAFFGTIASGLQAP